MMRVVITGLGFVSSLGLDAEQTWKATLLGRTGLGQHLQQQHPGHHRASRQVPLEEGLRMAHQLEGPHPDTGNPLQHAIHHQEGEPVGKLVHDLHAGGHAVGLCSAM